MASLVNWLIYFLWVKIFYVRITWLIDFNYWQFLIKEAIPLGMSMLLRRVTIHTDTFLLAIFSTAIAVGLFNSAYQPIQMLEGAILALSGVLFPVFSRLAKESMPDFQRLFSNSLKFFIILSAPLAVWLLLLSQKLIILIYGVEYQEAGGVLAVLGLTLFFLMPGALFFAVFSALNRQRLFLLLTVIGFTINVSLDILLIPLYDYLGAAIATFITEATVFISGAFLLYRLKIKVSYLSIYLRSLLAIVVPSILLLLCVRTNNYWLITLGSCFYLIIYFWIVVLTRLIRKNELDFFRNLLNRKISPMKS
jgi:O-antigen/teichoic acid export membrane protein